jgi:murein DD-endopeptidase MepM/ murein hydrolase activator NlpD
LERCGAQHRIGSDSGDGSDRVTVLAWNTERATEAIRFVAAHQRLLAATGWLVILGAIAIVLLLYTPLPRIATVIRLWTEELVPPLRVPVHGVDAAALADTWGAARSGGRSHEGIDIFAPCGHPVVSATRGVIVSVGENRLGGLYLGVLGPGGSWHYYAHLSRVATLRIGDVVRPGDTVGYVGDTGNARGTPCHLHYGIYLRGKAQNPHEYLRSRASPAPVDSAQPPAD